MGCEFEPFFPMGTSVYVRVRQENGFNCILVCPYCKFISFFFANEQSNELLVQTVSLVDGPGGCVYGRMVVTMSVLSVFAPPQNILYKFT